MYRWILCLGMIGFLAAAGCGIEATPVTLNFAYTEPTTNADGTPLLDLGKTTLYCAVGQAPPAEVFTQPASAANGGGSVADTVSLNIPSGAETIVDCYATASDFVGNESLESGHIVVTYDFLAPAAPVV